MKNNRAYFLLKRLFHGGIVLFVTATLTFFAMKAVPGGPFDRDKVMSEAVRKNLEARYGLDKPTHIQYMRYMVALAKLDFGTSFKYRSRSVNDIIAETFPVSMTLGLSAFLFAVLVGVIAGTGAGLKPGGVADKGGMLVATIGISVPNFVLGAALILAFSIGLKLLPPALWENAKSAILPALSLGGCWAAYIARMTRSSVIDAASMPHVVAARAKGSPPSSIVIRHILRSAIAPVITILGPVLAALVTGSFVIEFMFGIPGMGKYFITAVTDRDYPLIMAVTLTYSAVIVAANIAVDFIYTILDPRVKLE